VVILRATLAKIALAVLCAACFVSPDTVAQQAQEDLPPSAAAPTERWHGRLELKRQNTSRGTPEETTQTTVRIESFFDGVVNLLRLDLPFPDEKTDFAGSPFHPRMGDVKIRARFQVPRVSGHALLPFVEATFPTADPESLGSGKYQLSAGVRLRVPLSLPVAHPNDHEARFETELQQTNSVGGDSGRTNINYTKFEFTLYDLWRAKYTFKLKLKPTVDWMQNGKIGTVGEVEGGMFFERHWRVWLMAGRRLSGPQGIKETYSDRLELGLARTF